MKRFSIRRAGLLLATVAATAGCQQAAKRPDAFRVYVTNEASGTLSIIDGLTRKVVSTVPLGKRPRGVVRDGGGAGLIVTLSGSPVSPPGVDESTLPPPDRAADAIGLFNTGQNRVQRSLRGVDNPEQVAASADGRIYAPCEERNSLVVLDEQSGGKLAEIPVGDQPEGVALSPDGKRAYVALEGEDELAVVDTEARTVLKRIPVGRRPRSIAVSHDGAKVYVTDELGRQLSVVNAGALAVAATVDLPKPDAKPMGVALSPDGGRIYVTTGRGGELVAIDAARNAIMGSVRVGPRPWGVAVSPDGRFLFTANGPSNDVTVVAAEGLKVVGRIKVGVHPWGVAVAPAS